MNKVKSKNGNSDSLCKRYCIHGKSPEECLDCLFPRNSSKPLITNQNGIKLKEDRGN